MARDHASPNREAAHPNPGEAGRWRRAQSAFLGAALVAMAGAQPATDGVTTAAAPVTAAPSAAGSDGAIMDALFDGVRSFGAATADALEFPDETRVKSFVNGRPLR